MRAVIQRVSRASVRVKETTGGGSTVGEIGAGLLVLLSVGKNDAADTVVYMADKVATLRIFDDADGKMNRSVIDIGGGVLAVSQFTLHGDVRKGRRPSFLDAAPPEIAEPLYQQFIAELRGMGVPVACGVFRATMEVELVNDGPVTILLDSLRQF